MQGVSGFRRRRIYGGNTLPQKSPRVTDGVRCDCGGPYDNTYELTIDFMCQLYQINQTTTLRPPPPLPPPLPPPHYHVVINTKHRIANHMAGIY